MIALNRVLMIGIITSRGPKISWTERGTAVCDFWLQIPEVGFDGAVHPQYCPVVAYGKLAESLAESLTAGQTVLIEGRMGWMPKAEGKAGQKAESKLGVVARQVTPADVPARLEATGN